MKAIVIDNFGHEEQLKHIDIGTPKPKENELLIEIKYAGVNPVDWKIREGLLKNRMPHEFPLIPGWDAAGIVKEVGKNVADFKIGDEVFAYFRKPIIKEGTYAEFICFDSSFVAKKPKNLNFLQASVIPLSALTAWQVLFDVAKLKKNQTALIHAGSGGVGGFAIQFAKKIGAKVFTTCSQANHEYAKSLGADYCIDYNEDNFVKKVQELEGEKIDFVFDTIGGRTLRESVEVLKPSGSLVSIVEQLGSEVAEKNNIRTGYVFVRPDGQQLKEISALFEESKIKPPEIQEMPLQDAAKAQEKIKQGHTRGKIALKVS